jgi:RNA polymerase II subunit A small phosphatase-like protein
MADSLVTQVSQDNAAQTGGIASLVTQVAQRDQPTLPESTLATNKRGICQMLFGCCFCCHQHPHPQLPAAKLPASAPAQPMQSAAKAQPAPKQPASDQKATPTTETQEDDPQEEQVDWLLPPLIEAKKHMKTLVLDLDETLVHSSFKPISDADFTIDIELEGMIHTVYVRKRPGVDEFMADVGKKWEVVIFTASLSKYADPLLDILDPNKVIDARLFREHCVQHYGNYVKDLSLLGRRLEDSVIVDNSPFSYMFQPDNAIPIISWFNDRSDTQLYELMPFLDSLLQVNDVSTVLQKQPA